ncbi:MAG TPA: prolyl oligopeptidase family serine peptidase [Phycisphaerae bacterium]|mgnify:CR=1 FL=1|nr:prolyl oligopeptidase family serine peptidase [Phycisphaerae bacterium]HRR85562.1 prolyl oligopeptidase family serine peptidase [Phycisphaerae bacterium]
MFHQIELSARLWSAYTAQVATNPRSIGPVEGRRAYLDGCNCQEASGVIEAREFEQLPTRPIRWRYLLARPCQQSPQDRWPLLLFLHGAGERGEDLAMVKRHGPLKVLEQGMDLPFVIAAPQCPPGKWWNNHMLIEFLDHLLATNQIDPDRVYLTGLSMGGFGTWNLATEFPERFAAIAPVCGGGYWFLADQLRDVPVWAFHGARDDVIPLEESERMIRAIQAAGGDARLTVYPEAGHDAWTQTYSNPELYQWFLSHRRT